jgi:hypothetical protein
MPVIGVVSSKDPFADVRFAEAMSLRPGQDVEFVAPGAWKMASKDSTEADRAQ